jgi:quinol monooxygenase YgiN
MLRGSGEDYARRMIVEYIRYEMPEHQGDTLVHAYEAACQSLRASSHCLGYELTRCTEAKDTLVLRILWDSADGHLEGFRTSPEFQTFFAAIKPFVGHIKEMRHYEATALTWTRVSP